MSRRKDYWGPTAMPGIRRGFVRGMQKINARQTVELNNIIRERPEVIANPKLEVRDGYSMERMILAGLRVEEQTKKMELAPLFWVAPDMARMALDASRDIPSVTWAEVEPTPAGIMAFAEPLPPIPGWIEYPIDAVCWYHVAAEDGSTSFEVEALVRQFRIPVERRFMDAPVLDVNGLSAPLTVELPFEERTMVDTDGMGNDFEVDMTEGQVAFLAFVATTMHMMMQPTVAHRTSLDGRTGAAFRAHQDSEATPQVTLIDLRPLRHTTAETEPGEGTRVYRHRWVVRGHWRQQRVGQDRAERRTTWIPSYLKGPAGAPLLATEKVMVWRR